MLQTTVQLIQAALKCDSTLAPGDRTKILALLRNGPPTPEQPANDGPRLLRRAEAARRLGRTVRSIDQLAAEGVLTKVRLPGRKRCGGILESSLTAAITAAV
jgi:hypothetical protein